MHIGAVGLLGAVAQTPAKALADAKPEPELVSTADVGEEQCCMTDNHYGLAGGIARFISPTK